MAAMLAGAEMTFIPGAMPVPRLPFPGSSNSSSYETTEKETDESPWSKRAEAIPAAAAETRANDVGVDPNLDFDDLFEDFIPPAASAPISMAPPADELALDPLTEQARAEAVAATHGVAASELPQSATDSDIEELLDDDELEIVLDD